MRAEGESREPRSSFLVPRSSFLVPHSSFLVPLVDSPMPLSPSKPRAIRKYGGIDSEALRKAALDTDIPVGCSSPPAPRS